MKIFTSRMSISETTDFGECNDMSVPDIVTAYQVSYTNDLSTNVDSTVGDNIDNLYKVFSDTDSK